MDVLKSFYVNLMTPYVPAKETVQTVRAGRIGRRGDILKDYNCEFAI